MIQDSGMRMGRATVMSGQSQLGDQGVNYTGTTRLKGRETHNTNACGVEQEAGQIVGIRY